MADVLIDCVNKQPRQDPHEGITHVGGPGGGGWRWPRADVIASIRAGANTFYTQVDNRRADVAVVEGSSGPYLRTHADRVWNDNLLALRECR